jgi:hypothetical protein
MGEMEQQRDKKAHNFFLGLLSDQLVFRRANGKVVDKKTFLKSLQDPNPFKKRWTEDIDISSLDGRALVSLVIRTMSNENKEARYRNVRLFSKQGNEWKLDFWYNFEIISS